MSEEKHRRRLASREVLFTEGDSGDCAYIVEAGRLEVAVQRDGKQHVLAEIGRGSLVGEMALLDSGTRTATVTAIEESQLRRLEREHLDERLSVADPVLRNMLHLVLDRYRDVVRRLDAIGSPADAGGDEEDGQPARRAAFIGGERIRAEQEIRSALDARQFMLHYQPVMRLSDAKVAGFEALIRWQHPVRGLVPPDDFVPVAESCGAIVDIGHWIIHSAVAALAELDRNAVPGAPLFMAINVSGRQFSDPRLFQVLDEALTQNGVAPERLRLEITESALFNTMDEAVRLMDRCNELGVKLTVDDFGTGYSALSYLYRLPVSGVKLAKPFIDDLAQYPQSAKIVSAVSRLAKELSLETVAEGIEHAEQARGVAALGVEYGQGFHYASALPLREAAQFLRRTAGVAGARRVG